MRIFDPKDQLGNSLLSSADTALSSKRLEKEMTEGVDAITLSSADISDIENWELCNASVVINGKAVNFLPETSKDEYGNIIVVFGESFENVVLILKRVEFGAMCEQEQLTIEVRIRRLMGQTMATAGKDGYDANENIQEWQKLGEEAEATGEQKYKYADVVTWTGDEEVGPTVTEQFLSLQNVPVCAFSEKGIIEWKSDLPCLQNGNSAFAEGPIEVFEGNMPNLVDGSGMFANNTTTPSLVSFKSEMPSLTNASCMFAGCKGLTSWDVELPNSLQNANSMFLGCYGLTEWTVALPSSLTDARSMFNGCYGLTEWTVALPNTITNAQMMFGSCSGLTEWTVTLPSSLTDADSMFYNCRGLTSWSVALPNSITDARYMFQGCTGFTSWSVALPNSLTNASYMFRKCSGLTSFSTPSGKLPDSITNASFMFKDCNSLSSFQSDMPSGLTVNADEMFLGCKLDIESVERISSTIAICTGTYGRDNAIHLGVSQACHDDTNFQNYIDAMEEKGWTVVVDIH